MRQKKERQKEDETETQPDFPILPLNLHFHSPHSLHVAFPYNLI